MGDPLYPASRLDGNQVLTHAFDEQTQRLRTDAEATIVNADIDVQLDADTDSVAIGDKSTGVTAKVTNDGSLQVIAFNQLVPAKFDKIEILAKNISGDPTSVRYSQTGTTVATLSIVYDIDGDISSVTRS